MSLSERLKKYNASAPVGDILRETVSLYHSGFSQDWHFTTHHSSFSANVRGGSVMFDVHPFNFREPEIGTSGKFAVLVDLFNSGPEFISELQAAAIDLTVPIDLEYNVFFEADSDSERDPITLSVTKVALSTDSATCTATRVDILNRKFPSMIYRVDQFPGLSR